MHEIHFIVPFTNPSVMFPYIYLYWKKLQIGPPVFFFICFKKIIKKCLFFSVLSDFQCPKQNFSQSKFYFHFHFLKMAKLINK